MKKIIYRILGCAGVALGTIGTMLPILPTVPFLMLAAYCFAGSSERLDRWFRGTRLYQDHLRDLTERKGMTAKAKIRILLTVTLLMGIGFLMMGLKGIVTGCAVLFCVWISHLIYFIFMIKTIPPKEAAV